MFRSPTPPNQRLLTRPTSGRALAQSVLALLAVLVLPLLPGWAAVLFIAVAAGLLLLGPDAGGAKDDGASGPECPPWCRVALDLSPDGVAIWDLEGAVVDCGEGLLRMFSYSREEAIGSQIAALVQEPSAREFLLPDSAQCDGRRAAQEFTGITRDGVAFPVHVTRQLVEMPDGAVILGFISDLTAQRAAEREAERRRLVDETVAAI